MIEREIRGAIPDNQFAGIFAKAQQKLGIPKYQKRLAINLFDWHNRELDIRVRITDKVAEVVQKVGAWDSISREEIRFPLNSNLQEILTIIKIFKNFILNGDPRMLVFEYENNLFDSTDYELKLSRQSGKSFAYTFEIEAKTDNCNFEEIASEFGLKPWKSNELDAKFWEEWNAKVTFDAIHMSEGELAEIIKPYL